MENSTIAAVATLGEDGSRFLASVSNKDSYDIQQLCASLKELRVLMQNYQKQESFRKMLEEQKIDFFQVLINIVKGFQNNDQSKLTLSYGFQTAINCMVSNNANKTFIFENLIQQQEADLRILLEYLAQDQKLMRFFVMILNSVFSEFSKEKVIESWKVSQYRIIFHGALSYFFHEEQSGKDVEHQNDQIFEWFYYLLSNIINVSNYLVFFQTEKSLLNILWRVIDQADFDPYAENNLAVDLNVLDKTKLRFLYFLHNAFEKTISEKSQTSLIINYTPQNASIHELYDQKRELGINISVPDYVFLIKIFNQLSESLIDEIQKLRDHNFENVHDQKPLLSSILDYFHAILKLFCQITFLGGYNKTVQEIFITNNSLASALKVFQIIYQLDRDLNRDTEPKIPVKITDIFEQDGYFELYLNFLRLISNIVHINLAAQNFISENNYLYLLLSFTVIDPNNPYIREWSIILIKNLTEANPAIQEKIAKLRTTDLDSKSKELLKKFQYDPDPTLFQERDEEEESDLK